VQTDIYSLASTLLGALLLGVAATWVVMRRRRRRGSAIQTDGLEGLYLIFSRLSHRLKTAGEVIRGHLHGFTDELPADGERWRVARRAISDEALGIDSLVNRLDLVVRLGMADQPLVMEPVNVPGLLEELMIDMAPAAAAKGIVLGTSVEEAQDLPHISADPMALREIFSNLVENAVKHSGSGTEVTAEVKMRGEALSVRIADTGKGMPQEALASIFERGSRKYRPGTARGTGMGLYLCKLLVELHGGDIVAKSTEGEGTEFQISLPAKRIG
jgi:two-component system sensor histidine kinase ResE